MEQPSLSEWLEGLLSRIADEIIEEHFGRDDSYPNIILGED